MDVSTTEQTPAQPPANAQPARRQGRVEMSVAQIIEKAEKKPAPFRTACLISLLAGIAMWACFPPLDLHWLAWLAPVPWLMLIRLQRPTRGQMLACYLGGLTFTIPALQWMRYGDPLMYFGWILLASYLAVYIPVFVRLSRVAVHRWNLPLLITAPVVWTGLEYLRGFLMTGFGWYYLGHTQYSWVELIQISDLVGAYGVSFVVMLFAAAVSLQIPAHWFLKLGLLPQMQNVPEEQVQAVRRPGLSLTVALLCLAGVLGYGYWRRSEAAFTPGPRVALVQGNFRAAMNIPPSEYQEAFLVHNELTGYAVQHQPDVIVWPEGMFRYGLQVADPNMSAADLSQVAPFFDPASWKRTEVQETLSVISEKAGAAVVFGLGTYAATPEKLHQYNSAQLVTPEEGLKARYDKLHRVPFGEYIPGQDSYLSGIVPEHFGLSAGQKAALFEYKDWRFAPVICFEDTVPHVTRRIVRSIQNQSPDHQPVDFLVNLSNDGWFAGSSEHDQHLITAQFRAVELRMPLVRSANMGISSFIDGDGVVMTPEVFLTKDAVSGMPRKETLRDPATGRYRRKLEAVLVQTIPLDARSSLYLWWGDWFAMLCLLCCGLLVFSRFVPQRSSDNNHLSSLS